MNLLYLIGEPGVGKSTLMAELVLGRRRRLVLEPFAHLRYEGGLIQLGRERSSGYSGTDALSMSVQPKVVAFLKTHPRYVLGEGDRLSNAKFFEAAKTLGYQLEVVLLEASESILNERRAGRGSNQDPTWLKGRQSKVKNLDPWVTQRLDATLPVAQLAAQLRNHPVFGASE